MRERPIANGRTVQRENLPFPHVEYPSLYGAFIGYREAADSPLVFCSCQHAAIASAIRITASEPRQNYSSPARRYIVNSLLFPESVCLSLIDAGITDPEAAISAIPYRDDLCHRCNQRVPACLHCHEMYAAPFEQTFGWYLRSATFALGHNPWQAASEDRAVLLAAEQDVRRAFGFPTRGARLTSEMILYHLTRSAFDKQAVLHHYRPRFLGGLELDIFLPSLAVAIEYQGEQHFAAMEHWGGEKALARTIERDRTKQQLCQKHGIEILYLEGDSWQFTEEHLRKLVLKTAAKKRRPNPYVRCQVWRARV
jgi:hypothetical protein